MTIQKITKRVVATTLTTAVLILGAAALTYTHRPTHPVADSSWGGIAPPAPTPTVTPLDSSWGG